MMKKTFKYTAILLSSLALLLTGSCSIGLGDKVDTEAPKIEITYPQKNAIVRDSFIAAGSCEDDLALDSVKVTVTETTSKKQYGPYDATINKDGKSWSVSLNEKSSREYDDFEAYKKWEFPDGDYIITAVSYDKQGKASQEAALPVSIDNTAPVLLVSKPLAVGLESASIYGRNLKIVGDISEEHETKKLTLYYKEYDETTSSFADSQVRTLEITGFGTMSSDNPLTIAKFDESTTEAANSLLTQNYKSIYGSQHIDITSSNKKNYYCGFLLEDNALIYRNPGDSGAEGGNKSSKYYILSDDFNDQLFKETAYSLNARSLMLLQRGQSDYSASEIAGIKAVFNNPQYSSLSASSTNLTAAASSKFSVDPKNNPTWSITNFGLTEGVFPDYEPGSAVPIVLKSGGDGIAINKDTISVKLYHLGDGETPETIGAGTQNVELIVPGQYTDSALKAKLTKEEIGNITFGDTTHPVLNHFYEIVISGEDNSGNALEAENGRYGFKYYSSFAAPKVSFINGSGAASDPNFIENKFYSGDKLNGTGTNDGIIIKGKVVTSASASNADSNGNDITIEGPEKIKVSAITITDTSDPDITVTASNTDTTAEVLYNYQITGFSEDTTYTGNGHLYTFIAKITKKNSSASLAPQTPGSYKYKVSFVAEDSLSAKNDRDPSIFEFKVDNKEPEISEADIVVTPTVTKTITEGTEDNTYDFVNGIIRLSGSVSDVGSGFDKLSWKVGTGAEHVVSGATSTWKFSFDTTEYFTLDQEDQDHPYKEITLDIIAEDKTGNKLTLPKSLIIKQSTDKPVVTFTNNKDAQGKDIIFSKTNKTLVGSVTDDDGLQAVSVTSASAGVTNLGELTEGSTSYGLNIQLPDAEGEYAITVTATDKPTTHLDDSATPPSPQVISQTVTIKKDNGAPELKVTSPVSTYYKQAVPVSGIVKDGSGTVKVSRNVYKLSGTTEELISSLTESEVASFTTATSDTTWTDSVAITENGTYIVRYTAKDKYGLQGYTGYSTTKEITFSFDKDAPSITRVQMKPNGSDTAEDISTGWYNDNSGKFIITTSDISADGFTGSGVASVAYTTSNPATTSNPSWINMATGNAANTWETDITFEDNATTKHLYIKATDKAGNVSEPQDVSLRIDVNKPTVTVSSHTGNVYVNKQSNLVITGTYFDGEGESGVEGKVLQFKIGDTELNPTITKTGNSYTVTIDKDSLVSGQLTVIGSDVAGNVKSITPCTITVDITPPAIKGLTLEMSNSTNVYKKAGTATTPDVYYLKRTAGSTLTISGTATDDYLFDSIEITITGTGKTPETYNTQNSTWSFSGIDFSTWTDASVTLTAKDKAGNTDPETFDIRFDETAPELKKDAETQTYTFRGDTVVKYNSLRLGRGRYSESSYGRQTAIEFTTYLTEAGSGLAKLEYRLYAADKPATTIANLVNGFDGTDINWTASGKFNIAERNDDNDYDVKATASISGFKPKNTSGSNTNYLLLRPTDNCGNTVATSDIEVLSIHIDQTAPTVVAVSNEKLTNGTADIVLSGAVYDEDAGLKALRVLVDGDVVLATDGELSNRYGTFTYQGYAPADPTVANPITSLTPEFDLSEAPSYATWTLTLTPDSGAANSWFDALPELPVIAIESEDWAEHQETETSIPVGNKAPNATKIAVLKIDTTAPVVENLSPSNGAIINGTNTITGSSSDVGSTPTELSMYYAVATSDTAPAELSAYTRLKTLTTASTPASPVENTEYGQSVSQLYNFSFTENFYDSKFIAADEPQKAVWILIRAKDEAGNTSAINPVKYVIDRNSDRPVVSFTDLDLTGVTSEDQKLLTEKKIYVNISDDDGIVSEAYFRTTRNGVASTWSQMTLSSGSGHLLLEDDGIQNIEFKVIDSTGKEFTSDAANTWERVYVKDAASPENTFSEAIPVILDTSSPEVTITQIRTSSKASGDSDTDWSAWQASGSFDKILGGMIKRIQLKFTAIDTGSGVDANTVKAEVKLGDATGVIYNAEKLSSPENTYVVEIPCGTGTGVLNVKLIAKDKVTPVKREGTTEKQFDIDNTAPEIHVESPGSDSEQSGTITAIGYATESVKLSYAISPIADSPAGYTASTPFSYLKKNSSTGATATVTLPAKDKSNNDISPASSLNTLCAYKDYSAISTDRVSTFYVYFDGTDAAPNHTGILNSWLKDIGITTEEDLSSTTDAFDDIVRLYLHLKAEDAAGNVSELAYPFVIDPQGDRPKVDFSYPSTDNPTLGGSINIIGSVTGKTSSFDIYMQIDPDGTENWDSINKDSFESTYGYTLTAIPNRPGSYGIKIPVNGTVWSKKINENGQFNLEEGETRKIKIRLYAIDSEGRISSAKTRTINVDNDIPVIKQDIKLVQWNSTHSVADGFTVAASETGEGVITFATGAVKAMREYSEGMNVAGEWCVVGVVSDNNGISEVRIGGETGTVLTQTLTAGSIIKPYTVTKASGTITNYAFCFPIGSNASNAVGTSEITFYAKDTGTGEKAKPVTKVFKLNYDNKAPEITNPIASGLKILNNNGYYTFGTEAFENSVSGANQSGVERIVFFFTRTLSGSTTILNPMIKNGAADNTLPIGGFEPGEEGLYWKSVDVSGVADSVVTVTELPSYAHKGGLAKVNGIIYKINNISGNDITLSGNPGDADSILFTVAGVIDSAAPEDIPGDATKISDDYGYGYPVSTHDDGDLMPESCIKSGTKCTWEASINSKNISDGPVTLHYIVFDKAGNFTPLTTTGIVQNNSPRLAGALVGTDEDGNGEVDTPEFRSYSKLYAGGYNGVNKITELTIPTESTNSSPVRAIKIKRNTVIRPEIIGGNGTVGYTYKVSARNATGWASPYVSPVTTPVDLGEGTGDSEDEVNLGTNGGIILTVKDLLASGITDGENQKFTFTIWDSTPGLVYGETTQSATLNVIMDVALDDTTSAINRIIPFYWKSAKENSLKDNSKDLGHIELSSELPSGIVSRNSKISGAVKLEGIAQDNSLLKNLTVKIGSATFGIASYENGTWTENSGTGWSSKIRQATYAEFVSAGYISARPSGKKSTDSVPYASQDYGHVVHWTMVIDTEALGITPATDISITVSAADLGSASVSGSGESATVSYESNPFATGDAASSCTVDVVPYIKGIKTALSKKSKKTDTSEYDRTSLGHYPVAVGEEITISGFNLANGTVIFTSEDGTSATVTYTTDAFAIPANAKSGPVKVVVGEVESLNNTNNDNAQGSYGATIPAAADYGKKATYTTFSNFYNRKPNITNNYILTDDVEIDIWQFNSEAAKPSKPGVISDPIMKINPVNNIIGFAYQSGPRVFSMAEEDNSYKEWLGDYDNLSAAGFAYDSAGKTYGTALGGDINGASSVAKFAFMTSLWGQSGTGNDRNKSGDKHMRFEQIGQIGTKADKSMTGSNSTTDVEGNFIDKTRALSPTIAVSGSGTNAKVYLAYYDHLNQEIRFRWASKPKSGERGWDGVGYINDNYGSKNLGSNGNKTNLHNQNVAIDKYSVVEFQIIAESKAYTYNAAGKGTETTSTALGKPGSYVSIDVIPEGTVVNGTTLDKDIIVLVWYDEENNRLMYTYNKIDFEELAAGDNKADFEGSAKTKDHWETPKQIFTKAGQYCQVKVDPYGGVHIAAYDNDAGDVRYAKLQYFNSSYTESTMSCVVDSSGIVGSNLTLDVALNDTVANGGKAIPYISYYGSIGPKMAYLTDTAAAQTTLAAGTSKDMFTGFWEVTEIPTPSNAPKDRINVGVWKTNAGVLNWSTSDGNEPNDTNIGGTSHNGTGTTSASGTTYGNGTKNPVVAYQIRPSSAHGYIETAQKK